MKVLSIIYAAGAAIMAPIALLICRNINKAETDYDDMVMADNGEYMDQEDAPSKLGATLFVLGSAAIWPFMVVIFPGLMLFEAIGRKFPGLMGGLFKEDE